MDQLFVVLLSGIASGAVYGLLGLSMVIIYRATDVFNFATASLGILCVYLAITFLGWGWGMAIAVPLALLLIALGGVAIRETVIRPLGGGQLFGALVVTMGVALIVEDLAGRIWSQQPRSFPPLVPGAVTFGTAAITWQQLVSIGLAAVAVTMVALLFTKTHLGTAMRAAAESPAAAKILGINSNTIARVAWALGTLLAGLAAVLIAPQLGVIPSVLAGAFFRAIAGIFLGGLTSMVGAVVGGLAIGVLDNLAAFYVSASFRDTFVFSIVILMLLIRPQGLFGRQVFQRV